MRCISPFDNGSYHMGTIRTNRTNRHLGQASLRIQRVGHILSPANDMHFSIRQRVVSHEHDSYESNESTTRKRVPFLGLQRVRNILSPPYEMHFSIRQRVVSHGHDSYESNESTTRTSVSQHTMRCISPSDNGSNPNRRFYSNCTVFLRLVSIQVY